MVKLSLSALVKAFSSEKIHLPRKPLNETRWAGITLIHFESCLLTRMDCSLPYPLVSDVSVQEFNSFLESKDKIGYKIDYKNGTVYIVDMPTNEHEVVIFVLTKRFDVPNGGALAFNSPLQIR